MSNYIACRSPGQVFASDLFVAGRAGRVPINDSRHIGIEQLSSLLHERVRHGVTNECLLRRLSLTCRPRRSGDDLKVNADLPSGDACQDGLQLLLLLRTAAAVRINGLLEFYDQLVIANEIDAGVFSGEVGPNAWNMLHDRIPDNLSVSSRNGHVG